MDQGVAASRTPPIVWGVVDLYGMAVKVTIVDMGDPSYPQWETMDRRTNNFLRQFRNTYEEEGILIEIPHISNIKCSYFYHQSRNGEIYDKRV